jgi:hypothetical protein
VYHGCPAALVEYGTSGVRPAGLGGIKQVEIAFDRFPQFVLRVAAVAIALRRSGRVNV